MWKWPFQHKASVHSALAGMFPFPGMEGERDKEREKGDREGKERMSEGRTVEREMDVEQELASLCNRKPRTCSF